MTDILNLTKTFELKLDKAGFTKLPIMQTRLAVDKSGSMNVLYRNGFVRKVIELFLGAAIKFDDNGELEFCFFDESPELKQSIKLNNYQNMKMASAGGGTEYTETLIEMTGVDAVSKVKSFFTSLVSKTNDQPIYLGFITDGEPSDKAKSIEYIKSIENSNVFVQIIVLGTSVNKSLLETYATNKNVAYTIIKDPTEMTTDEFYEIIANQKLLKWVQSL